MPKVSASWNASLPMSLLVTWPVMATTGIESMRASTSPVTRLVAPGPEVAQQTPTLPVDRAKPSAAKAGILLMTDEDMADRVVVHGVVEREGDAARVAEDALDAFADEALQQDPGAAHQGRVLS